MFDTILRSSIGSSHSAFSGTCVAKVDFDYGATARSKMINERRSPCDILQSSQ